MWIKTAFAAGLLGIIPALTGCLSHTRTVPKTRLPDVVLNASLDDLLNQVDQRYKSTNSMTLFVEMSATTGGSFEGKVKESLKFSGYIVIQNPDHILVVLKIPLLGSRAMQMVSDGQRFKMIVPPRSCAILGSDESQPSQKGLYSLRPAVILDSLLVKGLGPDHLVSVTQGGRIVEAPRTAKGLFSGKTIIKGKDLIEEPDYDLEFLSQPQGTMLHTLRVLHVSRVNLLPYRQDIYNSDGKIQTTALYSGYQKFGEISFPTTVVIQRPLDELSLTINITRGTNFNHKIDADTFEMPIPSTYAVQNMDDPVSSQSNPCVAHAPQSQH